MGDCCNDKNEEKKFTYFGHIKASVFCAIKGHLIFQLAFISYINYSLYYFLLRQQNNGQPKVLAEKYLYLRKSAGFSMVRNTIPFLEVAVIMPLVCFGLPKIPGIDSLLKDHMYLYCTLICIVLMVSICFTVRTFELREKLAKCFYKDCTLEKIKSSFKQDDIHYPIYENGSLEFNSPNRNDYKDKQNSSSRRDFLVLVLLNFITLPLKLIQATTMLSLAAVELAEAIFNFPFDLLTCYNNKDKFAATESSLKRSGYLLYGFVRNTIDIISFPVMVFVDSHYQVYKGVNSPFIDMDNAIAKCIGEVKSTCCST